MTRPPRMRCRLLTGAWMRSGEREVWSGPQGIPQIPCGYEGGPHTLLCHLIATHGLELEHARTVVVAWTPENYVRHSIDADRRETS